MKKPRCHNCKHAGPQFKAPRTVLKPNKVHCEHAKHDYSDSPWGTLQGLNDTCSDHEFKDVKKEVPKSIIELGETK